MLTLGTGEIVSRLRRGLSLRGKVDMGLEHSLVPTVQVQAVDKAPFRRTGRRWFVGVNVPAVVGQQGRVRIINPTGIDQLVTQIAVRAMGASGVVCNVGTGPTTGTVATQGVTTENNDMGPSATTGRLVPVGVQVDSITPSSLSRQLWRSLTVPQQFESIVWETELVLPAAVRTNQGIITVECESQNVQFHLSVSGLYFDDLPLDANT